MVVLDAPNHFNGWRLEARALLNANTSPKDVFWTDGTTQTLFSQPLPPSPQISTVNVSKKFLNSAKRVSLIREVEKWNLLYRVLWRLVKTDPNLLEKPTDPDIVKLTLYEKAIRRDIHKMHAFVRFKVTDQEQYVAWYQPSHIILEAAAPFFVRRFGGMNWTIFTPDASAHWNKEKLVIGPGVPKTPGMTDNVEELWKDYYSSIFNPARVKIKAMKAEMPVKFWGTLPEAELIPDLIRNAPKRVDEMVRRQLKTPARQLENEHKSLSELKTLSMGCTACHLYKNATQTVFGEGPRDAKVIFIGEQPGDEEDIHGRPFIGPAGKLFNRALVEAGIERKEIYITNAVKHFKNERQEKHRLHKRPNGEEINACKFWLLSELEALDAKLVVCLGATAAQSVLGRAVKISDERGRFFEHGDRTAFITTHPSALLRMPDTEAKEEAYLLFTQDLRAAKEFVIR